MLPKKYLYLNVVTPYLSDYKWTIYRRDLYRHISVPVSKDVILKMQTVRNFIVAFILFLGPD